MSKQEELLAELRRKVAAKVPPELVEREMIKVLAVIRRLLAGRRADDDRDGQPLRRTH